MKHIADAEGPPFLVINIEPDFCIVEGAVVPFDICRELGAERGQYIEDVHARGHKILTRGSVIDGVVGDAGAGVLSGTATSGGSCVVIEGLESVTSHGRPVARHGHLVHMNCS